MVVILPGVERVLRDWAGSDRRKLRNRRWAENFRRAARNTVGRDRLRFHDLRHSYAKYMLANGIDIGVVAMSLGNGIGVCQEYYTGKSISTLMVSGILAKFDK